MKSVYVLKAVAVSGKSTEPFRYRVERRQIKSRPTLFIKKKLAEIDAEESKYI
jgi:ribosomal protein S10